MNDIERRLERLERSVRVWKAVVVCVVLGAVLPGCTPTITSRLYPDAPIFERRPANRPIDVYLMDDAPSDLQEALPESRTLSEVPPDAIALGRLDIQGRSNWFTSLSTATSQTNRWGGDAIVIDAAQRTRYGHKALSGVTFDLSAEVIRYREEQPEEDPK